MVSTAPEEAALFWKREKKLPTLVGELKQLTIDYAKQETLEPLKALGRYVGFGLAGALLLATGVAFLVLGALRVLQTETGSVFTGHLSWAPYFITLAGCALVAGLSVNAIGKEKRAADRRKAERASKEGRA